MTNVESSLKKGKARKTEKQKIEQGGSQSKLLRIHFQYIA
jgi:hypothetical protein